MRRATNPSDLVQALPVDPQELAKLQVVDRE